MTPTPRKSRFVIPVPIGVLLGAAALLATGLSLRDPQRDGAGASSAGVSHLASFGSGEELRRFLRQVRERTRQGEPRTFDVVSEAPAAIMDSSSDMSMDAESITNTQEVGVDEGGIVKQRGNLLVILRRGRLFTVSLAGGGMRPVDSINAFPPGVSSQDDWYDELLIHGDRVIVVGYSYGRGGTEINRFRLDAAGRLLFEDCYHLKSNDYYSSRNYASRLIGDRLIFYTPLYLNWRDDPLEALPGISKWRAGAGAQSFRPIAAPRQVFIAASMRRTGGMTPDTLHSVTSCDLAAAELDCSAVAVLGPSSRTFYVSGNAVYVWAVGEDQARPHGARLPPAFLYRLPFGAEAPSAIAVEGAPVDQFSFQEEADNMLNVLVRAEGGGDSMGGPEVTAGGVTLLRLPLGDFNDGSRAAAAARYRPLPEAGGDSWSMHNRFVGNHVLYGGGALGEGSGNTNLVVAPVAGGEASVLRLGHAVERIEALGSDALVVGANARQGLGFTAVDLGGRRAVLGDIFTLPAASEGETRSHAFFFRPTTPDGASGIVGLPIGRPVDRAYERFFGSAASMLFLLRTDRRFADGGLLEAHVAGTVDDGCLASCTDWYGNARPIFLDGRIFALLGYELVEGRLDRGRIREIGRVNFAPRPLAQNRAR
jgi:hypothetical protein